MYNENNYSILLNEYENLVCCEAINEQGGPLQHVTTKNLKQYDYDFVIHCLKLHACASGTSTKQYVAQIIEKLTGKVATDFDLIHYRSILETVTERED